MYKKTLTIILITCFIVSMFMFLSTGNAANYGIQTQIIDSVGNAAHDFSLTIDSNGYPHFSYDDGNNGGLKYAWWNGNSWNKQVVDNHATKSTLKLDSNGYPHITYFDNAGQYQLKYAYWNGATWICQTVDPTGEGRHASLAVDSQGFPHISYGGGYSLKYASWDGNQWDIQVVDPGVFDSLCIGYFSSLQIDSNDHPHIAYNDETNGLMKYAYWNGVNWNIETIDSASKGNILASLAIDSTGAPCISYVFNYNLKYAEKTASTWEIQTIDVSNQTNAYVGESVSLSLDSLGIPHISYIDQYRGNLLKYAFLDDSSWKIYGLTASIHGGYSTSLAIDANNKIHIVHGDYTSKVVEYFSFYPADLGTPVVVPDPKPIVPPPPRLVPLGAVGIPMVVDSGGNVGMYTSIVLDANGNPHVSYYHSIYGLKYAASDGSNWKVETVDSSGWPGLYSSIALDSNGNPHMSYYENFDSGLRYAYRDGVQWIIQAVDTDKAGSDTSLVLDSDNHAHISYFEWLHGSLKYGEWNGSSWVIQTVDSTGDVGEFTSIALDKTGKPCISYYDVANGDLKFARWTGSNWTLQTIDAEGYVGYSTSMKIGQNNDIHISYLDKTTNCLKYAKSTGSGWAVQTVGYVGNFQMQNWFYQTSLALDVKGHPHISYYNATKGNLGYTYWNGTAWIVQTADSSSKVGLCSSLALDQNDRVHISYYDEKNRCLKYIVSVNASGFPSTSTSNQTPEPSTTPNSNPTPNTTPSATHQINIDLTCKIESALNLQATGTLTADGNGISGADILLSYSTDNGATWSSFATAKTNSTGHFTAQSSLPATSVYLVKAIWSGNATYPAAANIVNLILVQTENQVPISINSNSTISAYEFNSTNKTFSFNVSGSPGTIGYASLYIPKSLVSDVTGLTVYFDDEELPCTVESDGDSWLVSLTYPHSSHRVNIQLLSSNAPAGPSLPEFLIALLLLAPIGLAVGVIIIVYRRENKKETSN